MIDIRQDTMEVKFKEFTVEFTFLGNVYFLYMLLEISMGGTSLVVQWLRLCSQCRVLRFDPWSES